MRTKIRMECEKSATLPSRRRYGSIFRVSDTEAQMEKFFNVAGPCLPAKHYMLPALERMPEIRRLVERDMYFVIHAPRQSGKTIHVVGL